MINTDALNEIIRLNELYRERWGISISFTAIPNTLTEERLILVLRHIVNTGESVLCGYEKVRDLLRNYNNYLMEKKYDYEGMVPEKPCPLCGNKIVLHKYENSYEFKCTTPMCVSFTFRGI